MRIDEFVKDDEDECPRCFGLKHHPSDADRKCPECNGTGKCPDAVKEEKKEKKGYSCRCGKFKCRGECAPKPDKSCRCGKIKCQGDCS